MQSYNSVLRVNSKQKKLFIWFFIVLFLISLFPSICQAELLGTYNLISGSGSLTEIVGEQVFLGHESSYNIWERDIIWEITPEHTGETLIVTSQDDPDFEILSSVLTNGEEDYVIVGSEGILITGGSGPGGSKGILESLLEKHVETDIDFAGYIIDSFALTVNYCSITYESDIWRCNYDVTYSINGHIIPEPATIMLLMFGFAGIRRLC